jgi:hypothetical protein
MHIASQTTQSVGDPLLCFIQWETHCNAICSQIRTILAKKIFVVVIDKYFF